MARLSVSDGRVQKLIDQLVPLIIQFKSVNGLCEGLNLALESEGIGTPIYPNRLHALLSDDPARALNEATISLVEHAISGLPKSDTKKGPISVLPDEMDKLRTEVIRIWRVSPRSVATFSDIAESLSLPPGRGSPTP